MTALPPGYRTTSVLGLTVLWRDATDGTGRCVTIVTATCPIEQLAEIAARDASARDDTTAPAGT
jgi:hypothetical protein